MNIEEDGMSEAVLEAGARLRTYWRKPPRYLGSGNVDWIHFKALKKIDIGPITFESFS